MLVEDANKNKVRNKRFFFDKLSIALKKTFTLLREIHVTF